MGSLTNTRREGSVALNHLSERSRSSFLCFFSARKHLKSFKSFVVEIGGLGLFYADLLK